MTNPTNPTSDEKLFDASRAVDRAWSQINWSSWFEPYPPGKNPGNSLANDAVYIAMESNPDKAVFNTTLEDIYWFVDENTDDAVDDAVDQTVREAVVEAADDPVCPALQDFLLEVSPEAGVA
jgi:hypothetical protein